MLDIEPRAKPYIRQLPHSDSNGPKLDLNNIYGLQWS